MRDYPGPVSPRDPAQPSVPARLPVPAVVRAKARAVGAAGWLDALPELIAGLEHDWSIMVGRPYDSSTEAFVVEAALRDGTPAVLKLMIPRPGDHARNEITVLKLTAGTAACGCCATTRRAARCCWNGWAGRWTSSRTRSRPGTRSCARRPNGSGAQPPAAACPPEPTRAAGWSATSRRPGRSWAARAPDARSSKRWPAPRGGSPAHDDERAVLVHGDVHQWNALQARRRVQAGRPGRAAGRGRVRPGRPHARGPPRAHARRPPRAVPVAGPPLRPRRRGDLGMGGGRAGLDRAGWPPRSGCSP